MSQRGMFVSAKEAAQVMGVTPPTVVAWTKSGFVPSVQVGKRRRIPRKQFYAWVRQFLDLPHQTNEANEQDTA